jgi:hypothetical protein
MDSVRIYSCYPRRFVDLLRRHGHTLKKFRENDASLKALVDRKNRIANWLDGFPENPAASARRVAEKS